MPPGAFLGLTRRWEDSDPFRRKLVRLRFDRCERTGPVQARRDDARGWRERIWAWPKGVRWRRHDDGRWANPQLADARETLQQAHSGQAFSCLTVQRYLQARHSPGMDLRSRECSGRNDGFDFFWIWYILNLVFYVEYSAADDRNLIFVEDHGHARDEWVRFVF